MALIKFGGGITEMRGSIAGNTFSRNRSGAYVRAKTKPINPNTAAQQLVRTALAQLTVRWSQTLTTVQRAAWNLYGGNVVMTNKLGESINLSGFNHYIRSNTILLQTANAIVDDGPTIFEIPNQDTLLSITASAATQVISVAFDDTLGWLDETEAHMFTFQGNPQNGQRNFFGGPWRLMATIDGDDTVPPTTPDAQAVIVPIAENQRQWIYARIIRADGRLSQPFRADVVVAA